MDSLKQYTWAFKIAWADLRAVKVEETQGRFNVSHGTTDPHSKLG